MSGAAFEGLQDILPAADGESYAVGEMPYDPGLIGEVVEFYLGEGKEKLRGFYYSPLRGAGSGFIDGWIWKDRNRRRDDYDEAQRGLTALIGRAQGEGFDHTTFLNDVLIRMLSSADPAESSPEILMDSLVQALYNTGRNGFTVDFREAERAKGKMPAQLGWGLKGDRERPLKATYHGNAGILGAYADWCEMDFHGSTMSAAYAAKDSAQRFHGKVEKIGGYAERSDLWYRGSLSAITSPIIITEHGTKDNVFNVTMPFSSSLGLEVAAAAIALPGWAFGLNRKGFLTQGNRLIIHAGKHAREVRW